MEIDNYYSDSATITLSDTELEIISWALRGIKGELETPENMDYWFEEDKLLKEIDNIIAIVKERKSPS